MTQVAALFPDLVDDYVCLDIVLRYNVDRSRIIKRKFPENLRYLGLYEISCHHEAMSIPAYPVERRESAQIYYSVVSCTPYTVNYEPYSYRFLIGQCVDCGLVYAYYVGFR